MARKKPLKLITLDTETYNGLLGKLKRIAIYDGKSVIYGYTFLEIEEKLKELSKKYTLHIYIHNAEFDFRKMEGLFAKGNVNWNKSFIINGRIAVLNTNYATYHDSWRLLPTALKKLSKDFDVEHGKLELWDAVQEKYTNQYIDAVDFLDRCDIDDELYLQYLGYDVISLYEILQKIIDISGLQLKDFVKRISTASLSRFLFKNGYKGKEFKQPLYTRTDYEMLCSYNYKDDLETEAFLIASYCGGRTEVFKPFLNHNGYHYDVNSLYPYVMDKYEFPIGKPLYYNKGETAKEFFENWMENHTGLGFIHAQVYIPKQHIPPLPCKMGKLVFPCGHVYGVWTYAELEYAVKECGVIIEEYFAVCHYNNTYPVFRNFIQCFYQLKEQATIDKNESLRSFAKLIMNVGYGYTGMSRDKTQLKDISELPRYQGEVLNINEDMGFIEIPSDIKSEYIQVQVASYVTSYARLVLLKALRKANENGEVYYCDTDSIVTDQPLDPALVHESHLGYWDCESKPLKALFLRPKVYAEVLEDKTNVKFKGVSKDTQSELNFEDYEHLYLELMDDTKDSIVVEKNKTLLRSIMYMHKQGLPMDYYEERDKKMNLQTVEKRNMNYKENYTEPLYFDSLEAFQTFQFKRPKQIVTF